MDVRLLSFALLRETDIILARQRTRTVAELLNFDAQDQTRITTAISEIVRNALEYGGGGRIEYWICGKEPNRSLTVVVSDGGRGIADLDAVLAGRHVSQTGMGIGIVGANRLMDDFRIETSPGKGTKVFLSKTLPKRAAAISAADIAEMSKRLAAGDPLDAVAEVRRQNREMLFQLREMQKRKEELETLNQELQDTNRGVVALYAELDERADHLRRADQLKTRFLSNMSHEFRTPLNSILSLSRLLIARTDGALSAEQEKQVQYIRKAAESLTELVDDLLDMARVEAGKTMVAAKDFSVGELFGALRGMLRPILVGDAVELIFEEPEKELRLVSDEGKVSQILRNFISNALKFTERGEVRVWADLDAATDRVTFSVRDTGIGIAEEDIDTIWQEFGQVPNRLQAQVKGTGLGLPLSKKLAALLGGGVGVESAPEQGSVFTLTLPRAIAVPCEEPDAPTWSIEAGRLPVLLLEDDAADSFGIERALARSRYQVLTTRNIEDANRALDRFRPRAVLLDVLLQGEESWRFLLSLKQDEKTRDIPVIVITSNSDERKARSLGADEYLEKPVDSHRLVEVLDELTGVRSVTKVLLVDDEEISRYLVGQLLPRGPFDLKMATNAIDGLHHATSECPDVVVFDLKMPDVDGFRFLELMSQSEKLCGIPAVAITSMALDEQQRHRLSKAARVVSKYDLTTETLIGAIRQAIAGAPPQ
jgi:signal transduction histidine kinase/DNA-binding response OmpR family regulator